MQFEAACGICVLDQVGAELLFADFDFQDVGLVYRHLPRAVKYNLEDKNILTFFYRRFVPIGIQKLFQRWAD